MDVALHRASSVSAPESYVMVPIDAVVLHKINALAPPTFAEPFRHAGVGPGSATIGVGDHLVVNIWEPSQDGVFATAENRQASLEVVVDEEGKVYIPYADRIHASGQTVEGLRQAIQTALENTAVEPQVQVLLRDNQANSVVIVGDVPGAGQLPIPLRGLKLMDAIAQSGGASEASYDTVITVSRRGRTGTVRMDQIVDTPGNNIWLAPGDNIQVVHRPQTYSAFGAVGTSGLMEFGSQSLSLTEALAQVGGLIDSRADAGGVFLLRFEDRQLAQWLVEGGYGSGVLEDYPHGQTPVIYRLDFKDPRAFFLAQSLTMRDKDVVYVANHPAAEFNKFLTTIASPLLGVVRGSVALVE